MQMAKSNPAYADRFDAMIAAIQQQRDEYDAKAAQLASKADTLNNKKALLQNQQASIQRQIELSQAQYEKLKKDIAINEKKIEENKEALGQTIADMYVDDTVSPLEMLASSDNIADYVDKQEYRSTIRDNLNETIDQIKVLKAKLEKQKEQVLKYLPTKKHSASNLPQRFLNTTTLSPRRRTSSPHTSNYLLRVPQSNKSFASNSKQLSPQHSLLLVSQATQSLATPDMVAIQITSQVHHKILSSTHGACSTASVSAMLPGKSTRRRATCLTGADAVTQVSGHQMHKPQASQLAQHHASALQVSSTQVRTVTSYG